jgi:carboxypeptidase D
MRQLLPCFAALAILLAGGCAVEPGAVSDDPSSGILGRVFHDPAAVREYLSYVSAEYPEVTELRTIGYSSGDEAFPILALKVTDNPGLDEAEPEVQIGAAIHGDEQITVEVVLRLLRRILEGYRDGSAAETELVRNTELHFMPVLNPHGLVHGTRENGQGVDLNRNFSWAWVSSPGSGAAPFDQAESLAVRDDALAHRYTLSLVLHSGAQGIVHLWDYAGTVRSFGSPSQYSLSYFQAELLPVYPAVVEAAHRYRDTAQSAGMPSFFAIEGFDWYPALGTLQDWMYGERGAIAYTIEVMGRTGFSASDGGLIESTWQANGDALLDLLSLARTGVSGTVIDRVTGSPVGALVRLTVSGASARGPLDPVSVDIRGLADPEAGDFHIVVQPGLYDLHVEAQGYESRTVTGVAAHASVGPALPAIELDRSGESRGAVSGLSRPAPDLTGARVLDLRRE